MVRLAVSILSVLLLVAGLASAQDQDRVFEAVASDGVIPYGQLKPVIEERYNGRIIGQELIRGENDQWIYHFKILSNAGAVMEMDLDAVTGQLIKNKD